MQINTDPQKIDQLLNRRVEEIYPSKEAFKKVLLSGKRLRIYQGFDPSSPNLHIGHLVGLLKLKEFQDLGHEVIFLIGDFTGMIGDPTGKIKGARAQLNYEQVKENAKTYQQQASMILNLKGNNPVQIKYNSEWLKKLSAMEAFRLMGYLTYAQIIKRDMFQQRLKNNQDIMASEFMYPFMQAYDSLSMDVDMEIGGSDQMFNMLVGRDLMKKVKNKEKFVMTTKLLVDNSGNKIGKTEGNAINLNNPPAMFYSQIMSQSDDAILPCFKLITLVSTEELSQIEEAVKTNPMAQKKRLAWELIKMLHDENTANNAQKHFESTVQNQELPEDIPTMSVKDLPNEDQFKLAFFLTEIKLTSSISEAKRLIKGGAVKIDTQVISNPNYLINPKPGIIIKVGQRKWLKLIS